MLTRLHSIQSYAYVPSPHPSPPSHALYIIHALFLCRYSKTIHIPHHGRNEFFAVRVSCSLHPLRFFKLDDTAVIACTLSGVLVGVLAMYSSSVSVQWRTSKFHADTWNIDDSTDYNTHTGIFYRLFRSYGVVSFIWRCFVRRRCRYGCRCTTSTDRSCQASTYYSCTPTHVLQFMRAVSACTVHVSMFDVSVRLLLQLLQTRYLPTPAVGGAAAHDVRVPCHPLQYDSLPDASVVCACVCVSCILHPLSFLAISLSLSLSLSPGMRYHFISCQLLEATAGDQPSRLSAR